LKERIKNAHTILAVIDCGVKNLIFAFAPSIRAAFSEGREILDPLQVLCLLVSLMMLKSGKFPLTARLSSTRLAAWKPGWSGICALGLARGRIELVAAKE
jgi:hypothetical protein